MKRSLFIISIFIIVSTGFTGCRKYDYFQTNPNNPSEANPALLLTNICASTFAPPIPQNPAFASRHMTYYERPSVYVNYNWAAGSFDDFAVLRQVQDMNRLAESSEQKNYQALAHFFRAVYFSRFTETFGDVPYSQALKALGDTIRAAYDRQEDVYAGILQELNEANTMLDPANGELRGDILFNGDVTKWKKLVNAFRLRLLIHLSKKENNSKLNIKNQFQSIVSDASTFPLMESIDDNAQLIYNTTAITNYYPLYQNNSVPSLAALEKGFVNILKDRNDPRLFSIAEPVTGMPSGTFSSYEGVDAGLNISDQNNASPSASKISRRYINDPVNEPMIFLSYGEQEFLIAEAIARGWITGDAALHYDNGITASMKFYSITDADIAGYLAQPTVVYNSANAVETIITQKYISFFMNSGWEPFFEHLRTGFPAFSVGPGTLNGGLVPKRFQYPATEYSYNEENVTAAVQVQFSGADDINQTMWVLQDE